MSDTNRDVKLDEAVKEALDEANEIMEEAENKPSDDTEDLSDKNKASSDKEEDSSDKKEESSDKDNASSDNEKKETVDDSEIVDISSEASDEAKTIELPPVKKKHEGRKQLTKKQKKRIRTIIILVIVAGLVTAGVIHIKNSMQKGLEALKEQLSSNLTPAQVERKDLTESISVTGKIRSNETRTQITNLASSSVQSAKILAVNVEVGDYVNEGDVLVTFSTESIEKDIARTQEDLSKQKKLDSISAADSQRNYVYSYQQASEALQENAKSTDRALKNLYEACDAYGDSKRDLQEAKDKKSEAERNLEEARGSNNAEMIIKYEQEVASYEAKIPQLENAVATAKAAEERAQQTYDDAVQSEQSTGAKGLSSGVQSIQNNLSDAESTYQKSIISSGDNATKYSRTLEDYEDKLDDYIVTASMSGLVTSVKVSEGNSFSSGEVLTIQDISTLKVDAEIDEYDIWKVKEGMRVIVKTEATGDDEFEGVVSLIHPTATASTTSGGSAGSSTTPSYTVTVELLENDERMMLGMTAKMSIIVDQASNVLCVPYDAIGQNADGEPVVYVLDDMSLLDKQGKPDISDKQSGASGVFNAKGAVFSITGPNSDNGSSKGSGKGKRDKSSDISSSEILVENGISGTETKVDTASSDEPVSEEDMYHELVVTKGMETDYYTEIITDGLKEGDYIVIKNEDGGNDLMQMMMGGMPPD